MESLYNEEKSRNESLVKDKESLVEEINKLKSEVEASSLKIKSLVENPVNAEAFQKMSEELELLKSSNATLLSEKQTLVEKASNLEVKKEDFEQLVEARSLEITQAQGVPPVESKPVAQPAASTLDVVSQLESITSPLGRREFWVKHEKELMKLLKSR